MPDILDCSVDAIITDPPYTDGVLNVLDGHEIQTTFSIENIISEFYRVLKKNSFIAFFGQMPTILEWHNQAIKAGFKFRIDIVWCKKNGGMGGNLALKKSHELIYVYSKGSPNYYKTNGKYSDVSQGQCEAGIKDIETVFKQLSYWRGMAQGKNLVFDTDNGCSNEEYFYKKGVFKKGIKHRKLGQEEISFNSVWAFSSHNNKHRNPKTGQIKHPTVKSIPLMVRLIELLSKKNDLILDPFSGSGTTAIACLNTNRNYICIEQEQKYFDMGQKRINDHLGLFAQNT